MNEVSVIVKSLVYKCMDQKDPVEAFTKTFPKEILENDENEFNNLVAFIKNRIDTSISLIQVMSVTPNRVKDSSDYFTYLHALEDTKLRAQIEILSYLEHIKDSIQIDEICGEAPYESDSEVI